MTNLNRRQFLGVAGAVGAAAAAPVAAGLAVVPAGHPRNQGPEPHAEPPAAQLGPVYTVEVHRPARTVRATTVAGAGDGTLIDAAFMDRVYAQIGTLFV